MARTKHTARKGPDRSALLQLMGFPKQGSADAGTVQANWAAVVERLSSHPDEAAQREPSTSSSNSITPFDVEIYPDDRWHVDKYPLFFALANQKTPLTKEALQAFIGAHPDIVTKPRSTVMYTAFKNPVIANMPEIIDTLLQANPTHLCGRDGTQTFQIMGFPTNCHTVDSSGGLEVDWPALEDHLKDHPEEAKILCPGWRPDKFIFPLEAALRSMYPPVPFSTVQLLLRLCPEAVTISDSSTLYMTCCNRRREDPDVIRAILCINPALADSTNDYLNDTGELSLPIHNAVRLPCAVQILPDLIEANPKSLSYETSKRGQTPLQVATLS